MSEYFPTPPPAEEPKVPLNKEPVQPPQPPQFPQPPQYPTPPQQQPNPYAQNPYGQPQYGQPQYGQPQNGAPGYGPGYPQRQMQNGLGTAALVLGIIGLIGCVYGGFILSILAIIFGKIGMNKARRGEANNVGVAKAGFILGIVGVSISVAILAIVVIVAASTPTTRY